MRGDKDCLGGRPRITTILTNGNGDSRNCDVAGKGRRYTNTDRWVLKGAGQVWFPWVLGVGPVTSLRRFDKVIPYVLRCSKTNMSKSHNEKALPYDH